MALHRPKACDAGIVSRYMGQENRLGEGELTRQQTEAATWPDAALHTPEWSPRAPDECGRGGQQSEGRLTARKRTVGEGRESVSVGERSPFGKMRPGDDGGDGFPQGECA